MISVIVPVYNVEKYVTDCLLSISQQTYDDFEVIVVDDGSTDNSNKVAKSFEKDARFKVYYKENSGLSDARNYGLNYAQGEFVTFIDSDDTVSKYYLENLYEALKQSKSDISVSNYELVYEVKIPNKEYRQLRIIKRDYSSEEALTKMFLQKEFDSNATSKLYKMELFTCIRFPSRKLYEDFGTTYKLFSLAKKITFISSKDYFYYQRPNSIQTMSFNTKKFDAIQFSFEMVSFIKKNYPNLIKFAKIRNLSLYFNIWKQIPKSMLEEDNMVWSLIKKERYVVLKHPLAVRLKVLLAVILTFFGKKICEKVIKD